jgi:iron complex transport system ATP-binding protein
MSLLSVANVSVIRERQHVLRDVIFSLEAAQVLCVLGANGAGKSTLLSAIAGELSFTEGRVALNGQSLSSFDIDALAELRALNVVEPPLAFSLSVFEFVALGRPFADVDCDAAMGALARCHATQWMNRDAASLSSGELLRVQLARSLYQLGRREHCVWLLDEPMAHLDLAQRQFVLNLLRDVAHAQRWAIIFTSHEPRDALQIADHVLLLKAGQSVAYGATKSMLTRETLTKCYDVEVDLALMTT